MHLLPIALAAAITPSFGAELPNDRPQALLTAACSTDLVTINQGKMPPLRCPRCPSESDFPTDKNGFYYQRAFFGKFSKPQAQALLMVGGCESMATASGGAYILTRSTEGWRRESYVKGFVMDDCVVLDSNDGLQALVCLNDYWKQGLDYYSLQSARFGSGELDRTEILRGEPYIGQGKNDDEVPCVQPGLVNMHLDSKNPAHRFHVDLLMFHGKTRIGLGAGCLDSSVPDKETHRVQLTYDFDGTAAKPDNRTAKILEDMNGEIDTFRAENLKDSGRNQPTSP